jgi:hypothetical protein
VPQIRARRARHAPVHPAETCLSHRLAIAVLLLAAAPAHARDECDAHLVAEFWSQREWRIAGLDAAMTTCPTEYSMVRAGFSYYGTHAFLYEGITASGRLKIGDTLAPWIGVGVLAGIAEDRGADDDGLDNDGDGTVDEAGEANIRDASLFGYPEVGLTWQPGAFGLTVAARKFYGREFDGDVIYSFGISLAIEGDEW